MIVFAPYGGTPEVWEPTNHPYVNGTPANGDLTVQVQNVPQYSVTIDAPSTLNLSYDPPELIWNPETLAYEGVGGAEGQSSKSRAKPEEEYTRSASVSPFPPLPITNCRFSTDPSSFSRQT